MVTINFVFVWFFRLIASFDRRRCWLLWKIFPTHLLWWLVCIVEWETEQRIRCDDRRSFVIEIASHGPDTTLGWTRARWSAPLCSEASGKSLQFSSLYLETEEFLFLSSVGASLCQVAGCSCVNPHSRGLAQPLESTRVCFFCVRHFLWEEGGGAENLSNSCLRQEVNADVTSGASQRLKKMFKMQKDGDWSLQPCERRA